MGDCVAVGFALSLQTYRWPLPLYSLMALGSTVHRCPLKPCTLEDLTCQAIKSTQSHKPGCPFPPPARRQGPSNPGHSIRYSLLVEMTDRPLQEDQK